LAFHAFPIRPMLQTAVSAMSERGSWCTEYIYCDKCIEAVRKWLVVTEATPNEHGKYWSGEMIAPGVFAGRIGDLAPGGELLTMEFELIDRLHPCHPIRVAVLGESGERFFTASPPTPSDHEQQGEQDA